MDQTIGDAGVIQQADIMHQLIQTADIIEQYRNMMPVPLLIQTIYVEQNNTMWYRVYYRPEIFDWLKDADPGMNKWEFEYRISITVEESLYALLQVRFS